MSEKDPEQGQVNPTDSSPPGQYEESKITMRTQILGLAICTGGFLFGYDIGVISGCLIMRDFVLRFGGSCDEATGDCVLSANTQAIITSLLSAGTFFGALFQAPISDYFGRKKSMLLWAVIFGVGAIIQTATETSVAQISVGRLVAGLGVGALSGLCPLYLGETAPKAVRGSMISVYQLLIIAGIALSYGIDWATSTIDNSASWRIPVGLQLLWSLMLVGVMLFLPESPRWKLQRGDLAGCRIVMAKMRGLELTRRADINYKLHETVSGQENPDEELVGTPSMEAELAEMKEGIDIENEAFKGKTFLQSYLMCFSTNQQMYVRTINGIMLQCLQQLNGQNFYYYYGPTFFQAAAISLNSYQIQFMFGMISLVCTVPAIFTIEKVGRRKSLMIGAFLEFVCAYVVAFVGEYSLAPDGTASSDLTSGQKNAGNAYIAFAVIHLATYSMFWGPTPWVYLGESFPQFIRAKCISFGSASNWFWNFMLSYFSPRVAEQHGSFIMLIFGSVLVFAIFYVFFFVSEVKGLSLEQVDEMFENKIPPWRTASWTPTRGDTNRNVLTLRR